ncbi:MAG: hypothetical protein WC301_05800 [Candidatus Omnitrophota bacterium]|jgi:hypothetical protein
MFNRKGQNIAEYSILIAIVIAAAVAMQVYVKRGIQGRVADAVDHAPDVDLTGIDMVDGAQANVGTLEFTTKQYEPYYVDTDVTRGAERTVTDTGGARGQVTKTIAKDEQTKTGKETTTAAESRQ